MPDTETQSQPAASLSRTVSLTLTPEDVVHAAQLHFVTRMRKPRQIFNVVLLGLLMAGAAAAALSGLGIPLPWPLLAVIAIASPIAGLFAAYGMHDRAARKLYAQQKNLQRPYEISWTDSELSTTSADGNWRLTWQDVREVKVNKHVIMFFESDYMFRIIPCRFLSAEQREDLLRCAQKTAA